MKYNNDRLGGTFDTDIIKRHNQLPSCQPDFPSRYDYKEQREKLKLHIISTVTFKSYF